MYVQFVAAHSSFEFVFVSVFEVVFLFGLTLVIAECINSVAAHSSFEFTPFLRPDSSLEAPGPRHGNTENLGSC